MTPHNPNLLPARQRAAWLLALTVVVIFYASFFPFRFDLSRLALALHRGVAELLPWGYSARADQAGNLLSYLPLGALAAYIAPPRWRAGYSVLFAVCAAALLSVTIELLQHATRSRVPNLVDVMMNIAGGALGSLVGAYWRSRRWSLGRSGLRHARPDPIALVLLALWFAMHAVPFMPRLNQGHAWQGMQPLRDLEWHPMAVASFFSGYLVVASAVRRLVVPATFTRTLLGLAAISLALRILFVGQWLTFDECLGLVIALPVATVLRGVPRVRAFRITLVIVAATFLPELALHAPSLWNEAVIFLSRAFTIVGVLWLASNAGLSLLWATAITALAVGVFAGPTAGLLAVVAGFLVHAGRVLQHSPVARV